MSASLDNEPKSAPDGSPVITPKLPPHYALGLSHLGVTAVFVVLFMLYSFLPLRATDLWGHTLWGRWILEHHQLPVEDPYFPLAEGMQVIDSAWLAQVIFGAVEQNFGPEGLSLLFAGLSISAMIALARTFYLISRRLLPMVVGVLLVLVVSWSRAATMRPECFGVTLLALLLWLVTADLWAKPGDDASRGLHWRLWIGVPLLMCLWANLHGSYLIGLIFLSCIAIGSAIDTAMRERSLAAIFRDAKVQRYAFLAELALAATLINPYGFQLLIYNLTFARNPNLTQVLEWQPLVILGIGGREFAVSIVLLLGLWRWSRAPVTATQVLLLALFGFAAIQSLRMLGWYAPIFAWTIMPHLSDVWSRVRPLPEVEPEGIAIEGSDYKLPPGRSFHYTLVCGLLIWIGVAFSPAGSLLLSGKRRPDAQLFDKISSPLELVAHLEEKPPQGQIFNPQHWGDWLVLKVPGVRPFVTSNIHLTPPKVWEDYLRISRGEPGWQRVLDRYNVRMLVLDKLTQPVLTTAMKQTTGWALAYEDDQAVIYRRIVQSPKTDAEGAEPPAAEQAPGGEKEPAKESPAGNPS